MVEIFDESCLELKSSWATIIVRVVEILSKSPYYLNVVAWRYSLGETSLLSTVFSQTVLTYFKKSLNQLFVERVHLEAVGSNFMSYSICRKFTG